MTRRYCDRCRKEITAGNGGSRFVTISLSAGHYGKEARIELCGKCYDGLGVVEKVEKADYTSEKKPKEVLYDLLKSIIQECVDEFA